MRGHCAIIDTVKHSIKVEGTQLLHTDSVGHMKPEALYIAWFRETLLHYTSCLPDADPGSEQ